MSNSDTSVEKQVEVDGDLQTQTEEENNKAASDVAATDADDKEATNENASDAAATDADDKEATNENASGNDSEEFTIDLTPQKEDSSPSGLRKVIKEVEETNASLREELASASKKIEELNSLINEIKLPSINKDNTENLIDETLMSEAPKLNDFIEKIGEEGGYDTLTAAQEAYERSFTEFVKKAAAVVRKKTLEEVENEQRYSLVRKQVEEKATIYEKEFIEGGRFSFIDKETKNKLEKGLQEKLGDEKLLAILMKAKDPAKVAVALSQSANQNKLLSLAAIEDKTDFVLEVRDFESKLKEKNSMTKPIVSAEKMVSGSSGNSGKQITIDALNKAKEEGDAQFLFMAKKRSPELYAKWRNK